MTKKKRMVKLQNSSNARYKDVQQGHVYTDIEKQVLHELIGNVLTPMDENLVYDCWWWGGGGSSICNYATSMAFQVFLPHLHTS